MTCLLLLALVIENIMTISMVVIKCSWVAHDLVAGVRASFVNCNNRTVPGDYLIRSSLIWRQHMWGWPGYWCRKNSRLNLSDDVIFEFSKLVKLTANFCKTQCLNCQSYEHLHLWLCCESQLRRPNIRPPCCCSAVKSEFYLGTCTDFTGEDCAEWNHAAQPILITIL